MQTILITLKVKSKYLKNPISYWTNERNKQLSENEVQISSKSMKDVHLAIREMKSEVHWEFLPNQSKRQTIKMLVIIIINNNKREQLYTDAKRVNQSSHYINQYGGSQATNNRTTL